MTPQKGMSAGRNMVALNIQDQFINIFLSIPEKRFLKPVCQFIVDVKSKPGDSKNMITSVIIVSFLLQWLPNSAAAARLQIRVVVSSFLHH
jgi:hypothetical protein